MSQLSEPRQGLSFLDLPVEIRLQIYQHLITTFSWGSILHILLTSQPNPIYPPSLGLGQLTYTPCLCPSRSPTRSLLHHMTTSMDLFRYNTHYETCKGWHIRNGTPPALQGTYLSIFLSCRTIHQEGIALLYKSHAFNIPSLPTLYTFLTQTPPSSLNYLTTLSLTLTIPPTYLSPPTAPFYTGLDTAKTQWITCAFLLSRLPSLSSLNITIWNSTYRKFLEKEMLMPLREVRIKEGGEFVVRVPYQEPGAGMYENESGNGGIKPGIRMRIERRPRNHEPVIESSITEISVNRAPTSGRRRRRRRCAEFMNSRFYGGGVLGVIACVFCFPFIAILLLWDWVVWNVSCFRC